MRSQDVGLATAGAICVILTALVLWRQDGPVSDPDPERYNSHIAAFAEIDRTNGTPQNGILFVGSSSISLWHTDSLFAGLGVTNRGLGGSQISDLNSLFEQIVAPYSPRTIVFYSGDNDINDGKSPDRVVDDFREFLRLLRQSNPDSHVLFLSIKPSAGRWEFWPMMQEANRKVAQLAREDVRLTFVDVATGLLGPDGNPNPDLFLDDALHLNDAGYRIWTDILSPSL